MTSGRKSKELRRRPAEGLRRTEVHFEANYSGPLPPPSLLIKYDEVVPGLSQVLVDEFREQSKHRRALELAVITGNVGAQRRGQYFGFGLGVCAIAFGAYLAFLGNTGWGIAVAIGAVGGLLGTFFRSSKGQDAVRERQRRSIHGVN